MVKIKNKYHFGIDYSSFQPVLMYRMAGSRFNELIKS